MKDEELWLCRDHFKGGLDSPRLQVGRAAALQAKEESSLLGTEAHGSSEGNGTLRCIGLFPGPRPSHSGGRGLNIYLCLTEHFLKLFLRKYLFFFKCYHSEK